MQAVLPSCTSECSSRCLPPVPLPPGFESTCCCLAGRCKANMWQHPASHPGLECTGTHFSPPACLSRLSCWQWLLACKPFTSGSSARPGMPSGEGPSQPDGVQVHKDHGPQAAEQGECHQGAARVDPPARSAPWPLAGQVHRGAGGGHRPIGRDVPARCKQHGGYGQDTRLAFPSAVQSNMGSPSLRSYSSPGHAECGRPGPAPYQGLAAS